MKLFSQDILNDLTAQAAASPRQRAHLNIHTTPADPVQRFFVATQKDTYFRPHRHTTKSELAVVLRGYVEVLTFDAAGGVTGRSADVDLDRAALDRYVLAPTDAQPRSSSQ